MLDQPVRLGLHAALDRGHVAVAVEGELRLGRLDRERALALPLGLQRGGGGPRRAQRLGPRLLRLLLPGEDAVDLLVVEARVGADRRAVEGDASDDGAVQLQLDRDREPVDVRPQRAGVVREPLRQHRLDLAGHVDGGRALERLAVDQVAGADVSGDVGDVDPDPPALLPQRLHRDRVVEVLRRRRVDREGRQLAQVAAAVDLDRPRIARGPLDGRVEAALEAAVEHQRLEHVGGDVGPAEPAHDLRVSLAAAVADPQQHEVAVVAGAIAVDDRPRAAAEERLADHEAAALLEDRDELAALRLPAARSRARSRGCGSSSSSR